MPDIPHTLYVVTAITNLRRFKRRVELYNKFKKHIESFDGVKLLTVECVVGHRQYEVTKPDDEWNLQLTTDSELWLKENLVNLGVSHLRRVAPGFAYVAWVDADVTFTNHEWVQETLHMLQHHRVVQMWQNCVDLGPDGEVLKVEQSFAYRLQAGHNWKSDRNEPYKFWHPGYAWAIRREAFDQMGGLMDFPILGSADHHMALCWLGHHELSVPPAMGDTYKKMLKAYQDRCHGMSNLGYVKGTIAHAFHGSKQSRKYNARWAILINNKYDPITDIRRDHQGVLHLNGNKAKLVMDIQHYFQQRNEDSIDLPCELEHVNPQQEVNCWKDVPPAIAKTGVKLNFK